MVAPAVDTTVATDHSSHAMCDQCSGPANEPIPGMRRPTQGGGRLRGSRPRPPRCSSGTTHAARRRSGVGSVRWTRTPTKRETTPAASARRDLRGSPLVSCAAALRTGRTRFERYCVLCTQVFIITPLIPVHSIHVLYRRVSRYYRGTLAAGAPRDLTAMNHFVSAPCQLPLLVSSQLHGVATRTGLSSNRRFVVGSSYGF